MYWIRIALATFVAAGFAFVFHVLYGRGWALDYQKIASEAGRLDAIMQEPYPAYIVVIAALTSLLPMSGKVILWLFMRPVLPGKTILTKGLAFTALIMFANAALLRQSIMDLLVGVPVDVWLVSSAEQWIIAPATCLLIVFLAPPWQRCEKPMT